MFIKHSKFCKLLSNKISNKFLTNLMLDKLPVGAGWDKFGLSKSVLKLREGQI